MWKHKVTLKRKTTGVARRPRREKDSAASRPPRMQFEPGGEKVRRLWPSREVERKRFPIRGDIRVCGNTGAKSSAPDLDRVGKEGNLMVYKIGEKKKNVKVTLYWKQSNWQECSPGHSTKPSPGTYAPRVTNPHAPSNPHSALSSHSKLLL